jgi:hypothetical protein
MMIAFMLLRLDKNMIMALSGTYSLFELPVRLFILATADGSGFDPDEWPVYVSIATAAVLGFQLGLLLRRRLDSAAVLRVLLTLIFLSSGILLGMLSNVAAAVSMVLCAVLLAALLAVAYRCPRALTVAVATVLVPMHAVTAAVSTTRFRFHWLHSTGSPSRSMT